MAGEYGLAQGIVSGMKEVQNGMATVEAIKQNRESKRQEAAFNAAKIQSLNIGNEQSNLQIEQLQMSIKEMKSALAKRDIFSGFDAYEETQDPKYLNLSMENPEVKKLMQGKNILSVSSVKDYTPEKLAHFGYKEGSMGRPIVVTDTNGNTSVQDLTGMYAASGYLKQMKAEKLADLTTILNNSKLQAGILKDEATAESTTVKSANDNVIAQQDMTMNAQKISEKNTELDSMEQWLADNPTKTVKEYEALSKGTSATDKKAEREMEQNDVSSSPEFSKWLDNPSDKLVVNGKEHNGLQIAREFEKGSKAIGANTSKYIYELPAALNTIDKVQTELKNMSDEDYNQITNAESYVNKYLATGSDKDKLELSNKLQKLGASAKVALLDYLTMKTGAAFSIPELQEYKDILFDPKKTREANINTTEGMLKSARNTTNTMLESIKSSHPYTYATRKKELGYSTKEETKSYKQGDAIKVGDVINGYVYNGGDTNSASSYSKAQ